MMHQKLLDKANPVDILAKQLRSIVGQDFVKTEPDELLVYECDGLPQHKYLPRAVVFPNSTAEVSETLALLSREKIPFTPRGAGTGLSGGALAMDRGVVIELARMRGILKIDAANRIAMVQPGLVNLNVSRAVAHLGLHYVPDPSSQPACSIGGNIAENAGGIHCLKYGTTTDHVLGLKVVLSGGEVVELGGSGREQTGYDLLGLFIGSEGTFGIATEATLRLTPLPPALTTLLAEFAEVHDASHAVSAIIAAGVMPAALEMMDREIIRAVEASVFAAGLPPDAGAALLIELDGVEDGLDEEAAQVKAICMSHGARDCREARDETERKKLWAARKGAFGAIGRIAPDSMIQDAVVPRSRLPQVLDAVYRIAAKYHLKIANVFHAGDGNLHPLICFDSRLPGEVQRVKDAGRELMQVCVSAGGSITGEHGVGFDKRELLPLIFSAKDMETMLRVRVAFDSSGLMNPGKIIPMLRGCGEGRAVATVAMSPALVNEPELTQSEVCATTTLDDNPSVLAVTIKKDFEPNKAGRELARIVGDLNVGPYRDSESLAVFPGTIDEVCEVMKLAFREGWSAMPVGAQSSLNPAPPTTNLVVGTRRLNRIIAHEPADLIAITEAGVTLKDFNAHLSPNGQWLPVDPPDDGTATIGGVVASGVGGAQQFGYGPPRRHVIGMKVVMADGSLVKAGGRVVKNVAGYDLCKMFVGSYGTLGIIVEVNFKLRPLPAATQTLLVEGEIESLILQAQRIMQARLFPVALELLSPAVASVVTHLSPARKPVLLIRFAGSVTAVAAQIGVTRRLFGESTGDHPVRDDQSIWTSLAALMTTFSGRVVWRTGLLPSECERLVTELSRQPAERLSWHAGLADGRLRVIHQSDGSDQLLSLLRTFAAKVQTLGGELILENAPPALRNCLARPETKADQISRSVKQQLDPSHVFPEFDGSWSEPAHTAPAAIGAVTDQANN